MDTLFGSPTRRRFFALVFPLAALGATLAWSFAAALMAPLAAPFQAAAASSAPRAPTTAAGSVEAEVGRVPVHMEHPTRLLSLDTGYILGSGAPAKVGIGETGFGLRDRVQITTNTLLDLATILNVQVKAAVLRERGMVPALALAVGYYNLVTADPVVDRIVTSALDVRDVDLSSDLRIFAIAATASRRVHSKVRLHLGYQYRALEGKVVSNTPVYLESEGDSLGVDIRLDGDTRHRSVLAAIDFDPLERIKLIAELGFDLTRESFRGGAGVRFAPTRRSAVQLGALWPGIEIEDEFSLKTLPHVSLFWRF